MDKWRWSRSKSVVVISSVVGSDYSFVVFLHV